MIEEILKKQTLDEKDIAILIKNRHQLSHNDLVRLGFAQVKEEVKVPMEQTQEEIINPTPEPKKRGRKLSI